MPMLAGVDVDSLKRVRSPLELMKHRGKFDGFRPRTEYRHDLSQLFHAFAYGCPRTGCGM